MPLQWTTVSVPLVGGLDTKSDEKTVLPTKLTELTNGEFTKGGSVRKRYGYTRIRPQTIARVDIDGLCGVFSRGDDLVTVNTSKAYSYDNQTGFYNEISMYDPVTHTAVERSMSTAGQTYADCASVNDVTAFVWEDSRGGIRGAVYNSTTGAVYESDWEIATSDAERPRIVAVESNLLVFYFIPSTDNIAAKIINTIDVIDSLSDAAVSVVTDVATTGVYDVCTDGQNAFLVYATDGTVFTGNRLAKVSSGGAASEFENFDPDTATAVSVSYHPGSNEVVASTYPAPTEGTDCIATYWFSTGLVVNLGPRADIDYPNVVNITTAPYGDSNRVALYIEQSAASADIHTVTEVGPFPGSSDTTVYRHSGLASHGWQMDGKSYVLLSHESRTGVQNSYYLLRATEGFVGRVLSGEGVGVVDHDHLPGVSATAAGKYQVALGFKRKLTVTTSTTTVESTGAFEHQGIKHTVFDPDAVPRGATLDNTLYLTGSQLWAFDGANAVEAAFHMFPDMIGGVGGDVAHNGTVDADIVSGVTYSYRVYYEWYSANGERVRSPAITISFTATAAEQLRLTIPTLRFTNKHNGSPISIVVYRTEGDSTSSLYYRVSSADPSTAGSVNGYLANSFSADTVTWDDGMPDADLLDGTRELDYISQGYLPNFAPESPEYVAIAQGRLFLAGGGQRPNDVRYSKLHFDGEALDFNATLAVEGAPDYGGRTVAVTHLNEVVIVFKESAIYALEGEGPDNTGSNGYYRVRPISSDTGVSVAEAGSIYSGSDGVYFKSPEGIYLLGQDASLNYVGAEVEAYNDQTIVATFGIPDTDQIVFLTSSGRSLMYDTYYRQWSTFTNHEGLAAAVWRETDYVYLRANGDVYRRSTSVYTDAGVSYKLKLRTAPLRLTDLLQGFWRCRKLGVLGEYKSSHRLKCSVYYNRDEAPFETFTWEPDDVLEFSTWGSEATWGATGTTWGGTTGSRDYRFTHRLARQKCESIRFEFEDLSTGTVPGASFELTELALEVGLRDGLGRIPATRKV